MALSIGIGRCSPNHQQKPLSSSEWDWDVHLSFQVLDVTPHLDSKGPRSLVDASSNGCWRSRYTTRYTVCNYVMSDIDIYIIYTYVDVSLSYLLFSSLILSIPIYHYLCIYICNLSIIISNSNCQQLYRWKIHRLLDLQLLLVFRILISPLR